MVISEDSLIDQAGYYTYQRGKQLFELERVDIIPNFKNAINAEVEENYGEFYYVTVSFQDEQRNVIRSVRCDCSEYLSRNALCEHAVGAILAYKQMQLPENSLSATQGPTEPHNPTQSQTEPPEPPKPQKPAKRSTDSSGIELITQYAQRIADESQPFGQSTEELARIECTLNFRRQRSYYYNSEEVFLTFKMGAKKLYVVKDIGSLVDGFESRSSITMGKKYTQELVPQAFQPESHALIEFICEHFGRVSPDYYYYYNSKKELHLDSSMLDEFLTLMLGRQLTVMTGNKTQVLSIQEGNPPLTLALTPEPPGFKLSMSPMHRFIPSRKHCYIQDGDTIYQCDEGFTGVCATLLQSFVDDGDKYFEPADVPALISSVISEVRPYFSVQIDDSAFALMPEPLVVKVYFDLDEDGSVLAHMTFSYGDETFDAFGSKMSTQSIDLASELRAERLISSYMGYWLSAPGTLRQDDEEAIYRLVSEGLAELEDMADVFLSDDFDDIKVRAPVNVSVGIRVEGRLLEVDLDLEGLDFAELAEVINSYRKAKQYHRLSDGSFLPLRDDALAQVIEMKDALLLSLDDLESGHLSLDISRSLYLDVMLKQNEQIRLSRDSFFKEIVRRMNSIEEADDAVPATLAETLRNYQVTGYLWLRTLQRLGFGGILADDMGLGKTLQVLAMLLAVKEEGFENTAPPPLPSIVVCPASLVYNWLSEATRFTPQLKVCTVAGNASERAACIEQATQYDLLVTSYDLLKRDIELYAGLGFNYVVLDEAQYIKNQNTQSAKAVKLLQSEHRLALTGTPIENSLAELWSIFDFLMPGYLYDYKRFKQDFEAPIVKMKDESAIQRLRALVRPFILRRMKEDVLKELPAKIEQVHLAEMDEEQRNIYLATLVQTKRDLTDKLAEAGAGQARIMVLAALTRLRQICCDPTLVFANYTGLSTKLQLCLELIHNSLDGGHRVVLFSQFTSMLAIIQKSLKAEGIEYYLLQGSTSKIERLKLVDQFNAGDVPVFLVSLKAGGTGLNLTGADIVIHYDPWWNLSAQNQATDRTHRIGQTKHVQVFNLIAKDTIEEKILKLQEAKAELAQQIIQKGDGSFDGVFDALSNNELIALFED